jgi:hypothetical protein
VKINKLTDIVHAELNVNDDIDAGTRMRVEALER